MDRYFIVGVRSNSNSTVYKVLMETTESSGECTYTKMLILEDMIEEGFRGKTLVNAKLTSKCRPGNTLCWPTGGYSRWESKPAVVLAVLTNESGTILGYKLADHNGCVKSLRLADVLAICKRKAEDGEVGLHNGIYIEQTAAKAAHIRCYPGGEYKAIVMRQNKPQSVAPAKIDKAKNQSTLEQLEQIFSKEQIEQLKLGKAHKVDIRVYGNKKFSWEQMEVIRKALERGLKAQLFAEPEYSVNCMKTLAADLRYGCDISYYLNPQYSAAQMSEISIGVTSGVDISKYSDPKIPAEEMAETRMRLENNIWKSYDVGADKSWEA